MTTQFYPYSRQGAAAFETSDTTPDGRRLVSADLVVTASDRAPQPARSPALVLLGPGDVVGIAPGQIVRRSPRPDDRQFEPNYLAAIEFAHPDLPWMFSPNAGAADRVDPWLMLVVIDLEPGSAQGALVPLAGSPNQVLRIGSADVLPDPANAWAFAHVQVYDDSGAPPSEPPPGTIRSRLLAPTRLHPEHSYLACVVPVYEAGRLAGLGRPPGNAGITLWKHSGELDLPVYDAWRFRTGPSGDFETLARKLRPVTDFQTIGERIVAVEPVASLMQSPGNPPPAPLFPPATLAVPTAIARSDEPGPLAPSSSAPSPQAAGLHPRLKALLDMVASSDDIVGPPLYGRWPALATSLDGHPDETDRLEWPPGNGVPQWIEELNADPATRMAAGVATRAVQHGQEDLMAQAWQQLDEVLAANRRIRCARVFLNLAEKLHSRVGTLDDAHALRLASPAFGRLLHDSGQTFAAVVDGANVPGGVMRAPFMRAARFALRAAGPATGALTQCAAKAIESFRTGSPAILPARLVAELAIDPSVLDGILSTPALAERVKTGLGVQPSEFMTRLHDSSNLVESVATKLAEAPAAPAAPAGPGVAVHVVPGSSAEKHLAAVLQHGQALHSSGILHLSPAALTEMSSALAPEAQPVVSAQTLHAINVHIALAGDPAAPPPFDFAADHVHVFVSPEAHANVLAWLSAGQGGGAGANVMSRVTDLQAASLVAIGLPAAADSVTALPALAQADDQLVQTASRELATALIPAGTPIELAPVKELAGDTGTSVVAALTPRPAYSRLLGYAHTTTADGLARLVQRSVLDQIMAAPSFPEPFVERIRAVDQNWVLGGLDELQPNSICILAANRRFVESSLAGANHEIARELLWRGFPTDLRGSCFRTFWPKPVGAAPDDIAALNTWTEPLGQNGAAGPGDRELTIIVVKGDLLRRYPNTIVTAQKGKPTTGADGWTFEPDGPAATEVFRGQLDPDVTYVALDVPIETLREPDVADRHGWYVSLRQPIDEPHFGMDEVDPATARPNSGASPSDWAWEGRADPNAPHLTPAEVDVGTQTSAQAAANLHQRPFQLLLHANHYVPKGP